jgi:hydrogenase maturation protease
LATLERPREQTTFTEAWQNQLKKVLKAYSPERKLGIVGLGHPMRGDDFVGSYAMKAAMDAVDGKVPEGVYLFDAEDNLEALVSRLVKLGLKYLIFIDACEMERRSGEVVLLSVMETSYPFFTTHGIPLRVFAERFFADSEVWILAIQPKQTEFDRALSPEVRDAAAKISKSIVTNLMEGV